VATARSKSRDWSIPALVGATVVCAIGAIVAATAPGAGSRALATCTPIANVPSVDSGSKTGQATGKGLCDAGAPSWLYTIRLVNRAGNALAETSGGPFWGTHQVSTSTVSCAGAYVHTYLYINVGGTGKSDTSGESSGCV
jgi:hypothetical protein